MCVSRRLLSPEAYKKLALARQAGNQVEAGLTFVAEEEEDQEEEAVDGRESGEYGRIAQGTPSGEEVKADGGKLDTGVYCDSPCAFRFRFHYFAHVRLKNCSAVPVHSP